jgi:hypothetical protein
LAVNVYHIEGRAVPNLPTATHIIVTRRVWMRYQIWIVGLSFAVFGIVGWLFLGYSPVFLGLMVLGAAGFCLGFLSGK